MDQTNNRSYTGRDNLQDISVIWYGDIRADQNGDFIEVPYCTYSDYSGGTVERSNCRVFLDMFKNTEGVYRLFGGYGTEGVLINKSLLESNNDIKEVINALENYPVISEDDLSALELELEEEAVNSWIIYDLTRELDARGIKHGNGRTLTNKLYRVMDRANIYFIHEDAVSAYLDINEVVKHW